MHQYTCLSVSPRLYFIHPLLLPTTQHQLTFPSLVLSTLQPLLATEPSRTCYRLIGGILVQRTVKDVIPALETNYSGIKEVLDTLVKNYKGKEEEFGAFQKEFGIAVSRFPTGV
jgi:prefoldin subunit 2